MISIIGGFFSLFFQKNLQSTPSNTSIEISPENKGETTRKYFFNPLVSNTILQTSANLIFMHATGEVILFGGHFIIRDFEVCDGHAFNIYDRRQVEEIVGRAYTEPIPKGSNRNPNDCQFPKLNITPLDPKNSYRAELTAQICNDGDYMSMEGTVGMIKMYAGHSKTPEGWIHCNGQELAIADYPDLFGAIGTKYGGDGSNTFGLPKLDGGSLSESYNKVAPRFLIATTTTDYCDANLGEIILLAGDTSPEGWVFCEGQEISIEENTTLFSVLGTAYGGNGRQNFGLPKLAIEPINKGTGTPKFIISKEGIYPSRASW